jgi:putative transposase
MGRFPRPVAEDLIYHALNRGNNRAAVVEGPIDYALFLLSRSLQSLTVAHTWHLHQTHRTVGHVWQRRFKCAFNQDDDHLLTMLCYIEANPLRARLVGDLAAYRWCSQAAQG